MTAYAPPKLSTKKSDEVAQGHFDFLVPYKTPLLRPDQVAKSLGERTVEFVYSLIERGKLEAHGVPGRKVERYTITKRSLLLYLAESANYEPANFQTRAEAILDSMTADQLSSLIVKATHRRAAL